MTEQSNRTRLPYAATTLIDEIKTINPDAKIDWGYGADGFRVCREFRLDATSTARLSEALQVLAGEDKRINWVHSYQPDGSDNVQLEVGFTHLTTADARTPFYLAEALAILEGADPAEAEPLGDPDEDADTDTPPANVNAVTHAVNAAYAVNVRAAEPDEEFRFTREELKVWTKAQLNAVLDKEFENLAKTKKADLIERLLAEQDARSR